MPSCARKGSVTAAKEEKSELMMLTKEIKWAARLLEKEEGDEVFLVHFIHTLTCYQLKKLFFAANVGCKSSGKRIATLTFSAKFVTVLSNSWEIG